MGGTKFGENSFGMVLMRINTGAFWARGCACWYLSNSCLSCTEKPEQGGDTDQEISVEPSHGGTADLSKSGQVPREMATRTARVLKAGICFWGHNKKISISLPLSRSPSLSMGLSLSLVSRHRNLRCELRSKTHSSSTAVQCMCSPELFLAGIHWSDRALSPQGVRFHVFITPPGCPRL